MNTNKQKRRTLCLAAAVIMVAVPMAGGNAQAKTPTKIYTCHDYVNLAREVGWSKAERANIKRIMQRESRCFARAWNKKAQQVAVSGNADQWQQRRVGLSEWGCSPSAMTCSFHAVT